MNILVATCLNQKLFDEYGWKFFDSYNWSFDLRVYSEDIKEMPTAYQHHQLVDLFTETNSKKFVERHKDIPEHNGLGKHAKGPEQAKSFDFDAVRFNYKVYAWTHAILNAQGYDGVICIDADSVFYKPIDANWLRTHIHRDDTMMTYMGRPNYSECGFLYFNMAHPDTLDYARSMQSQYDNDHIFNEDGPTHDSIIWDKVRVKYEEKRGTKNHNIGDDKVGHVQARGVLGDVYDHIKGPKRKKLLKSPESRVA